MLPTLGSVWGTGGPAARNCVVNRGWPLLLLCMRVYPGQGCSLRPLGLAASQGDPEVSAPLGYLPSKQPGVLGFMHWSSGWGALLAGMLQVTN